MKGKLMARTETAGELDHSLDPSLHTTVRLLMPLWMMGTALW